MARGFWEDIQCVEKIFGEAAFREALPHCRPGVMDTRSWNYWHHRLGINPIPELPRRRFG